MGRKAERWKWIYVGGRKSNNVGLGEVEVKIWFEECRAWDEDRANM